MKDIILLDYMSAITSRAITDAKAGYLTGISGREGVGKSILLRHIEEKWEAETGRRAFWLTMSSNIAPLRALQHMAAVILGESMPKGWKLHNSCQLEALVAKSLKESGINLILIDRSDRVSGRFIDHVITILSLCRDKEWQVGAVLTVSEAEKTQLEFFAEFSSSNISVQGNMPALTPAQLTAVISVKSSHFADFRKRISEKDGEANEIIAKVHEATKGIFRRLDQFANYLDNYHPDITVTKANISALLKDAWYAR